MDSNGQKKPVSGPLSMVNPDRIERLVAEGHLDSAAALCEAESEKSHLDEVRGVGWTPVWRSQRLLMFILWWFGKGWGRWCLWHIPLRFHIYIRFIGCYKAIIYFQDVNSCGAVFGLYNTKPSVVQKGLESGDFRVLLPWWFELVSWMESHAACIHRECIIWWYDVICNSSL